VFVDRDGGFSREGPTMSTLRMAGDRESAWRALALELKSWVLPFISS